MRAPSLKVRPIRNSRYPAQLAVSLGAVYFIWGSGFIFSKIGATHLPVTLFSGVRFFTAGLGLVLLARFGFGKAFPTNAREWRNVWVMGLCCVVISNGLNMWAIQFISSSESALLNTTSAIWIAALGAIGARGHPLSMRAGFGLFLGILGTALTVSPHFEFRASAVAPYLGAVIGCLSWSIGTLFYRNSDTAIAPLMFVGLQMLTGGAMQLLLGFALGQASSWTFNRSGLIALVYLSVFSSGLAYTAYGWLTRNTTPVVIGSFSYVNPALASILGWWFLNEQLLPIQVVGLAVIIAGVALATRSPQTAQEAKVLEEPASP